MISGGRGRGILAAVAVLVCAVSVVGCGTANGDAAAAKAPGSVSFGISGGNMVPWSVDIQANGNVVLIQGASRTTTHPKAVDARLLRGLFKLARTEGYFGMSSKLGVVHPDSGQLYLRFGQKRVYELGSGHVARFDILLKILEAVSGHKGA